MNNQEVTAEELEIDFGEIIALLLSRAGLILAITLFTAVAGFAISRFMIQPTYDSTTKIYILNKQDNTTVTYNDVQVGTQLTKDYAELVKSRFVLEEVIQELDLKMSYDEMERKLTVSTPSDTRILAITVRDKDPVEAMKIANAIRETAAVHITNVMDIEAVNVVETANIPMEKSTPNIKKWVVIGGMLGGLLICVVVFIIYILDDTIKSADDIEKYLHLSTLALIPIVECQDTDMKKRSKKRQRRNAEDKQEKENIGKADIISSRAEGEVCRKSS